MPESVKSARIVNPWVVWMGCANLLDPKFSSEYKNMKHNVIVSIDKHQVKFLPWKHPPRVRLVCALRS